jgi:uncharacterized OsmC-like protein
MDPKPAIFIVRIWQLPEGFKASLRAVDSEETRDFASPEALVRYLIGAGSSGRERGGEYGRFNESEHDKQPDLDHKAARRIRMSTTQTQLNGVNVDRLLGTISAIKENPNLARFTFRAKSEWVDGGHSRTRIQGFYGAGQEDTSRTHPFVLEGDEPPVLLGSNRGPNAVEAVLHALASCLAVGFVYNAAAQGIKVDALEFDIEGDLDLRAFLGLSDEVRPGYEGITVRYRVKADAPREKLVELCDYVQKTSPVLDILRSPVPVSVSLEG